MTSRNNVRNTHIAPQLHELHAALLDIVSLMNQPQRDEALIRAAGIPLDRALFPVLVGIGRFGPIGVVEIADRVGRDYTTLSRQVAKLEKLGFVERRTSPADGRVREARLTAKGRAIIDQVDEARERMGGIVFASWEKRDVDELVRLMRKFADTLLAGPPREAGALPVGSVPDPPPTGGFEEY